MSIFSSINNAISSFVGKSTGTPATPTWQQTLANVESYNAKSAAAGGQVNFPTNSIYNVPGGMSTPSSSSGISFPGTSSGPNQNMTPLLPVPISSGQQSINSSGGVGSSSYGPSYNPASVQQPVTISRSSLGSTSGLGVAPGVGSSGGGAGTQPLSLPNALTSTNPQLNTTGLAGILAETYTRNPDGSFTKIVDTAKETDEQTAKKTKSLMDSILGPRPDINSDSEVVAARQQRQQIQQALLAPTAELNAVIAKQNQDLLQLRKTGSQEGVTEAVYGGQSNAINYNAAIRALPLQASIAGLQGDLKLAQDYLSELTQIKTEQINNQYEYNKSLFTAISGAIEKKDQRAYEELKTTNENARKDALDLEDFKAKLALTALGNGGSSVLGRIHDSKDKMSAVQAAGQYATTPNTQITQLDNGDTVIIDKTSGKIVSNLGGRKASPVANIAGLTPQQANDPFIAKLAASAGGKPITDTFAQQLNKGLTVLGQIGTLQTNIKDVKTGPIVGAFKGANPWDTNAQTIKAQLNAIVPNLARGVYGEVGVLTDNDVANYSKTLPNLKSTEDIRNAVLGITVDLIGKSLKRNLEINAANGKDVSGFIDIYTEMQNTRDGIFSQIPGYKGATSSVTVTPEVQSLRSKYDY